MLNWNGLPLWICLPPLGVMIIALALFFHRRHQYPIRERHPILSLFGSSLVATKFLMISLLSSLQSVPCVVAAFDLLFLTGLAACAITYRAVLLYLRHNILQEQNALNASDWDSGGDKSVPTVNKKNENATARSFSDAIDVPEDMDFMEFLTSMGPSTSRARTIIRLKRITTPVYIVVAISFFTFVFGLTMVVASLLDDFNIATNPTNCELDNTRFLTLFWTLITIVVASVVTIKIREVQDSTLIKRELGGVARVSMAGVSGWFTVGLVPFLRDLNENTFPLTAAWLMMTYSAMLWFTVALPLRASIWHLEKKSESGKRSPTTTLSLNALLESEEGFRAFRGFLETEFSQENLLFYRDVEEFRKTFQALDNDGNAPELQRVKLCAAAMRIFKTYIDESSPLQVNIRSEIFKDLKMKMATVMQLRGPELSIIEDGTISIYEDRPFNSIEDVKSTLFDAAQTEIYVLMEEDSFLRFKLSPTYGEVLKTIASGAMV